MKSAETQTPLTQAVIGDTVMQTAELLPEQSKARTALLSPAACSRPGTACPPPAVRQDRAGCLESAGMMSLSPGNSLSRPLPPPILDKVPTSRRKHQPLMNGARPPINTERKPWFYLTKEEKQKRKFNRAYQRFMLGRGFDGQYRLITLTTPEGFTGDIHNAWEKWVKRMRRKGYRLEYYAVKEWNAKRTCIHIHAVLRLDYIGYSEAREQWKAVTGAVWIHVEKVYTARGMANYLGKYLNKGYKDNPGQRGYWYSQEWIHPKWAAFNKAMYKYGQSVTSTEFELIHGLRSETERLNYMNYRMIDGCLTAIRAGRTDTEVELPQFKPKARR